MKNIATKDKVMNHIERFGKYFLSCESKKEFLLGMPRNGENGESTDTIKSP